MRTLASLVVILAFGGAATACRQSQAAPSSDSAPFVPVASVLMHPRCINCHQDDSPRQGDEKIRHRPLAVRGPDGRGAQTQPCPSCHQPTNTADGAVPGAPGWRLAPLPMLWEGLTTAQLCARVKDPAHNGGRTGERLLEHVSTDPFVFWAWNPGGRRARPPLSHAKFVESVKAWIGSGMPCP